MLANSALKRDCQENEPSENSSNQGDRGGAFASVAGTPSKEEARKRTRSKSRGLSLMQVSTLSAFDALGMSGGQPAKMLKTVNINICPG
jgi:hypothetical protein